MAAAARKRSRWALIAIAALAIVALVIPATGGLSGIAVAAHATNADPDQLSVTGGSGPTNTCIAFTVNATSGGAVAEGETVDVRVEQSDTDTASDLVIGFCDPDGSGTGTNMAGDAGTSGAAPFCDIDDDSGNSNGGTADQGTFGGSTLPVSGNNTCGTFNTNTATTPQNPAVIHDECFTDSNGRCTIGVMSNEAGTATVTAWFDNTSAETPGSAGTLAEHGPDSSEPQATGTVTIGTGGAAAVSSITCSPSTQTQSEGGTATFGCTVQNASGQAVQNVTVTFDVTAGPNAEERGPLTCTSTNISGQTGTATTGCSYSDAGANTTTSPAGTDTVTACVDQPATPGQVSTSGCDPTEPKTTISVVWVGNSNKITCTPDGLQSAPGTSVTVTCTTTDPNGNAVNVTDDSDTDIDLVKTSGPGTITNNTCDTGTTSNGTCTATISTNGNESGTTVLTGSFSGQGTNCTAGTPPTANTGTSATCTDTASVVWQTPTQAPPTENEHSRTANLSRPRHARLGGRRRLVLRATISSPDFESCATQVPVNFQVRAGGSWITIKSDTTNDSGVAKGLVQDLVGKYRAKASKFQIEDTDANTIDTCLRAVSNKRRHRHGG